MPQLILSSPQLILWPMPENKLHFGLQGWAHST